jgi:predicted Rossmann-fold nucleotide-binding protein
MREIDNNTAFKVWLHSINDQGNPVAVQCLDLQEFETIMLQKTFKNCLFLSCKLSLKMSGYIVASGGWVIPQSDQMLFPTHKANLYSPQEIFAGFDFDNRLAYHHTYDYKIYTQYKQQGKETARSIYTTLMRRLHDHSISDALMEAIEHRKVVAIMGGHSMERSDVFYTKVALIARNLTLKGYLMVSGGGPGAMEATHLGAYFASYSEKEMLEAIELLQPRPEGALAGKEYLDWDWLHRAMLVRQKYPLSDAMLSTSQSIGIPTWLYGHEPPAAFATQIAKYFSNAVREDGLVSIAKHGIIFAPGSAGTTQEIFQDACQNHYAPYNQDPTLKRIVSPMILMGKEHWQQKRPLWDLLKKVAKGRPYEKLLYLSDQQQEIIQILEQFDPKQYSYPPSS